MRRASSRVGAAEATVGRSGVSRLPSFFTTISMPPIVSKPIYSYSASLISLAFKPCSVSNPPNTPTRKTIIRISHHIWLYPPRTLRTGASAHPVSLTIDDALHAERFFQLSDEFFESVMNARSASVTHLSSF